MRHFHLVVATTLGGMAAILLVALGMGALEAEVGLLLTLLTASVLGGGLFALLLARGKLDSTGETPSGRAHPGINLSHIPVAGLPGLVFALGFVWMFWFGVPHYRPIVVGVVVLGCLVGLLMIGLSKRRRSSNDRPLGLSDSAP